MVKLTGGIIPHLKLIVSPKSAQECDSRRTQQSKHWLKSPYSGHDRSVLSYKRHGNCPTGGRDEQQFVRYLVAANWHADILSDKRGCLMQPTSAHKQAQAASQRGMDALGDMASQARDVASNASDFILAYTKKNPAQALAIAVVAGALLFAFAKANAMRRD